MPSELLGVFEGRGLEDGTLAFYPTVRSVVVDDACLAVTAYALPVTPPADNWYIARGQIKGVHTGLDINLNRAPWGDVELGEPVRSTCGGLVVFAGMARGTSWGNVVITVSLDNGGLLFWRYGHLQRVSVEPGQLVPRQERIGTIGKGYNDRYPAHLHLDAWRGQMIAPESWLAKWVVWVDPLDVWAAAGFDWKWSTR